VFGGVFAGKGGGKTTVMLVRMRRVRNSFLNAMQGGSDVDGKGVSENVVICAMDLH